MNICPVCNERKQFIDGQCRICYEDVNQLERTHRPYMQYLVCAALMGGDWDSGIELSNKIHPRRYQ